MSNTDLKRVVPHVESEEPLYKQKDDLMSRHLIYQRPMIVGNSTTKDVADATVTLLDCTLNPKLDEESSGDGKTVIRESP